MKLIPNYLMLIILFFVIVFRSVFISAVNNLGYLIFNRQDNIEIKLLKEQVSSLEKEYTSLLDFKNKINIDKDYTITNSFYNNYSYDKLLVSGKFNIDDEVVSVDGLVGLISKVHSNYSEITYNYKLKIPVIINNIKGKITSYDDEHNLIVKELTNYQDINLNDKVYTVNNTYIGKVIKINNTNLDKEIIVKGINLDNIHYVGVINSYVS